MLIGGAGGSDNRQSLVDVVYGCPVFVFLKTVFIETYR